MLRPGALGDTILTLPALRALRLGFPSSRVHLVGNREAAGLLRQAGEIDDCTDFQSAEVLDLFSDAPSRLLERLQPVAAAVAWLGDPNGTVRRQFQQSGIQRTIVASSRPPSGRVQHSADHLLRTLEPWRLPWPESRRLVLPVTASAGGRQRSVVIHPGSGSPSKNWAPEAFARVIDLLVRDQRLKVMLLCGPADQAACEAVLRNTSVHLPLARPPSALQLGGLLAGAGAYLGNDSGVSHLAAALGVPTAALFGPTDPAVWAPRGESVTILPFDASPSEVAGAVRCLIA